MKKEFQAETTTILKVNGFYKIRTLWRHAEDHHRKAINAGRKNESLSKMKTTSMKTGKDLFQTSLALGLFKSSSLAQCPNNNNPYGNINNLNPGQTSTVFCMFGGK